MTRNPNLLKYNVSRGIRRLKRVQINLQGVAAKTLSLKRPLPYTVILTFLVLRSEADVSPVNRSALVGVECRRGLKIMQQGDAE